MPDQNTRASLFVEPPSFLSNWRNRIILAAILVVPFFVPIPRVLQFNVVISELGDRLHVVLLGGVTFFLYWYGPFRRHLFRASIVAAAIGGAIELLQLLVGRYAYWHDFYQDLIGIGIAFGFLLWRSSGSRLGLALMVTLALLVPFQMRELPSTVEAVSLCHDRFPLLGDFEQPVEKRLWSEDDDCVHYFSLSDKEHNGTLRFETGPSDFWPGVIMRRFPPDWSGFKQLTFEIRLVETKLEKVPGGIIISDYDGISESVWKKNSFRVTSKWQTVAVPLDDLGMNTTDRELDISDIFSLKIFLSRPSGQTVVEIDNLRLE